MTALVSAFSRAYHAQNAAVKIFDDGVARALLSDEEYGFISKSMAEGISFFSPGFSGSGEEALRFVVDEYLSPSPLGRAAFAEAALKTAVRIGARQYVLLGAGYDTFAYRQSDWARTLQIFELDRTDAAGDKRARLARAGIDLPANLHFADADLADAGWAAALAACPGYDPSRITFCSLLGVTYYLEKTVFCGVLAALNGLLTTGSTLVFDYPDENSYNDAAGPRAKKQALLAGGAKEAMRACYSYEELERLLSDNGFLIYEHLAPEEITAQYFAAHNAADPDHAMTAFDNVNYCLAVRR